jgi:hypothetical protein
VRHHGFDPQAILMNGAPVRKPLTNEMVDLVGTGDAARQPDRIGQKDVGADALLELADEAGSIARPRALARATAS